MSIHFSKKAAKLVERLDSKTKARIKAAVYKLPQGDTKLLTGQTGTWRLRVGRWRILFSYPRADVILIEKIAPRGHIYKG